MYHMGSTYMKGVEYLFYVKSYEFPNDYGINGGRIYKLEIWKNKVIIVRYDNGWISRPVTKTEKEIFEKLISTYN